MSNCLLRLQAIFICIFKRIRANAGDAPPPLNAKNVARMSGATCGSSGEARSRISLRSSGLHSVRPDGTRSRFAVAANEPLRPVDAGVVAAGRGEMNVQVRGAR